MSRFQCVIATGYQMGVPFTHVTLWRCRLPRLHRGCLETMVTAPPKMFRRWWCCGASEARRFTDMLHFQGRSDPFDPVLVRWSNVTMSSVCLCVCLSGWPLVIGPAVVGEGDAVHRRFRFHWRFRTWRCLELEQFLDIHGIDFCVVKASSLQESYQWPSNIQINSLEIIWKILFPQ